MQTYRSLGEMEVCCTSPSYLFGAGLGTVLVDAVRRAVDNVGSGNIDGRALRTELAETDVDMVALGWGNQWGVADDLRVFAKTIKLLRYDAEEHEWLPLAGYLGWQWPSLLEAG
jgi:hypothetical protein